MQPCIDEERLTGNVPCSIGEKEKPSIGNVFSSRRSLEWRHALGSLAHALDEFGGHQLVVPRRVDEAWAQCVYSDLRTKHARQRQRHGVERALRRRVSHGRAYAGDARDR